MVMNKKRATGGGGAPGWTVGVAVGTGGTWPSASLPVPVIYSPFSKDLCNYASGTPVPFWSIYAGTDAVPVKITTTPTLLTSAGCLTKTGTGTSYVAATTNGPNNTFTFPVNTNGYTISYWIYCATTACNGCPVSLLKTPNTTTFQNATVPTVGTYMSTVGVALFQPRFFGTSWNSGYPQTAAAWVHFIGTQTTAGVINLYLAKSTENILTRLTTTVTTTYTADSGINDIRLFSKGGFNNASSTSSYTTSTSDPGNLSIAEFYYFDSVLTSVQMTYLHANQVFST
jgi:hypothetical protein